MRLYRKVFVRSCKEHLIGDAHHFIEEKQLRVIISNMFDDGVAEYPIKCLVRKREFFTRVLDETFAGKQAAHPREVFYAQSRVCAGLMSIVLEEIISYRQPLCCFSGYAYVQNRLSFLE